MATEMFGGSPDELRQALLNQRAAQFATQTPQQQLGALAYKGGAGLGQALGGLFGVDVTDPEMRRLQQRQELIKGINPNEPASLKLGIEAAMAANDYAAAQDLATKYQNLLAKQASTEKDVAAAKKEKQLAIPADVLKAQREAALRQGIRTLAEDTSTEALQTKKTLEDELAALTRGKEATPTELATLFNEQGKLDPVKDKAKYDAYTAKIKKLTTGKSMGEEIGAGVAAGLGVLGEALKPALKKEGEKTGEFAATDFNTLGSAVAAGTASKRNVRILKENLDSAFTGSFADAKKGVSSALIGLGLPVGTDIKNAVSGTELINAMGTRYVFPLVKNFPGSLAAKELDRLEKTAPNTLQQPETIKRLVSLLEADIAENEFTYNRAKKYKEDKKSVIGFNQADQKIEFQQKYNQLQDLVTAVRAKKSQTSSEAAQINALRKELGL